MCPDTPLFCFSNGVVNLIWSLSAMEIINEGVLEIGTNPDSKSSKDWKARLFVLKFFPSSGRATLDFYKNTSKRWQKQTIKGVISLFPYFEISIAHQCSYKYTFKISTPEGTVYLAASNSAAMNKWMYFIQTQKILEPTQDMYIFDVQAQDSDFMNLIGAVGDCQLVLTPSYELQVVLLPKKVVLAVWPFDCLKTFSYGGSLFSFQAGRHAPRGPGEYSFITNQDHHIHSTLHKLIDNAKRSSFSSDSRISISDRPPAQLPQDGDSSSESPVSGNSDDESPYRKGYNLYVQSSPRSSPPPLPGNPPPKIPPKGAVTKSWLHERYGSSLEPETIPDKLVPQTNMPNSDEDHVYSHTLHRYPPPFNSPRQQTEDNPMIYNSLVHQGRPKKLSIDYDIAYPDQKQQTVVGEGGVKLYSYIGDDKNNENVDFPLSSPLQDVMTANPLYGSKGNLLDSVVPSLPYNEGTLPPGSQKEGTSPPRPPKGDIPSSRPSKEGTSPPQQVKDRTSPPQEGSSTEKLARPDVTANPVYITSTIRGGSPTNTDTTDNNKDKSGYTIINKAPSPQNEIIPSSVESDPPPIPERQYSFNESEHD